MIRECEVKIRVRVGYYTSQVISHLKLQFPYIGIRLKLGPETNLSQGGNRFNHTLNHMIYV